MRPLRSTAARATPRVCSTRLRGRPSPRSAWRSARSWSSSRGAHIRPLTRTLSPTPTPAPAPNPNPNPNPNPTPTRTRTRLNRTVFELALAALEALPSSLGAQLYFPGGDAFSAFGGRQQLLDMHKLWQGRPRSEFGGGGSPASRFIAGFAEAGRGGWAEYKKRLERQHSAASVASRAACDLVEKSGVALPAQLDRIAAATCDAPQRAHVRFSTAHR
jgi:hypothetical protein